MQTKLTVGDRAIYLKDRGAKPIATKIESETATGQIYPQCRPGERFKFHWMGEAYNAVNKRSYAKLYPYTDATWARLTQEHQEHARKLAKRAQLDAEKLAAVKAATGGHLKTQIEQLPDGSRFYTFRLPIKPEYAERKKGFEIAIVRCADYKGWARENAKPQVESHLTFCNGSTSSFASCSGERYDNDEDALWACACYLYNRD